MKTIMLAAQSLMLGAQECIVAGGMESMSNVPYYLPKSRAGLGYGHQTIEDGIIKDGLWDVYNQVRIVWCAHVSRRHVTPKQNCIIISISL